MGKRIKELKLKCPETHKREATKMPSRGEMSGQDWNTVAFGNKRPQSGAVGLKEAQRSGQVEAKCRQQLSSAPTSSGISAAQLENETDELKHASVPKDLKLAIMKARQAKQLTQSSWRRCSTCRQMSSLSTRMARPFPKTRRSPRLSALSTASCRELRSELHSQCSLKNTFRTDMNARREASVWIMLRARPPALYFVYILSSDSC